MKELKNRAEIVAELAKMLREFDLALNPYDTDVYSNGYLFSLI